MKGSAGSKAATRNCLRPVWMSLARRMEACQKVRILGRSARVARSSARHEERHSAHLDDMPSKRPLQGRHRLSGRAERPQQGSEILLRQRDGLVLQNQRLRLLDGVLQPEHRIASCSCFDTGQHTASSTRPPARVASVTSMSRLNLSYLPRTRSDTLDWPTPRCCAAWACVQPLRAMVSAQVRHQLGAHCQQRGLFRRKTQVRKHIARGLDDCFGLHHASLLHKPITAGRRARCLPCAFSASSSGTRAAHIPHARTWRRR